MDIFLYFSLAIKMCWLVSFDVFKDNLNDLFYDATISRDCFYLKIQLVLS